jgi:hypothetical protein
MRKKRTIYRLTTKDGIVAGVSDTKSGAEWIRKQYPKYKLKTTKIRTSLPYGSRELTEIPLSTFLMDKKKMKKVV